MTEVAERQRGIELGAGDWVPLPGDDAIEVFVEHVGPRMARGWWRRLQKLQRDEADRRRKAQRERIAEYGDVGKAKEADPVLFDGPWDSGDVAAAEESQKLFDDRNVPYPIQQVTT